MSEIICFSQDLATQYSIEEAILIQHFIHWIKINQRLKQNSHDGRTWSYQTQKKMAAHFQFWSEDQLFRFINKLIDKKILIKGNYNKTKFDRTIWYAFSDEDRFLTTDTKVRTPPAKSRNGNRGSTEPIPDSITDTIPKESISKDILKKGAKAPFPPKISRKNRKELFEVRKSIWISNEEMEKLKAYIPEENLNNLLDQMEDQQYANNKFYSNHYNALRSWYRNEQKWTKERNKTNNFHSSDWIPPQVDAEYEV